MSVARAVKWTLILPGLCAVASQAATTAPHEDLHYLAEHLAEAAQDARYYALPWPAGAEDAGVEPLVGVARAQFQSRVADARGTLFSAGIGRAWDARWRYAAFVFEDRFGLGGGTTNDVVTTGPLGAVPLDLPEQAEISAPSGRFIHRGLGLLARYEPGPAPSSPRYLAGVLFERLTLADYRFSYRLTAGADAGAQGVLDFSGSSDFLTPMAGLAWDHELGSRLTLTPRAVFGLPLPPGRFESRMSGPGFEADGSSPGAHAGRVGDMFLALNVGLRDRVSGVEYDLGALWAYGAFERVSHEGVRKGVLFSILWRRPTP